MKIKKLMKKWGKIKLWETSAVGIPIYPAAHKSYSLVKALRETEELVSEKLNMEKSPMGEDKTDEEKKSEESESEVSEPEKPAESEPEKPAEESEEKSEDKSEEEKPEEKSEESEEPEVEKSFSKEDMVEMMTKGFQAAIKASSTPRGLIDNETQVEKMKGILKEKSLGDLAIMNGMFKAPDMYGRII